jgi:hypothetical protein
VGLLMTALWIPGRGSMDTRAYRVDRAVNEYNDRLSFGRNEDTGDWCVFMRMPSPEPLLPLFGFGDSIPEPDEVIKQLWKADSLRHGDKILNQIIREQEDRKKRYEYAASQASEESAEVLEHFLRKKGKSPIVKSLPKGVSTDDVG